MVQVKSELFFCIRIERRGWAHLCFVIYFHLNIKKFGSVLSFSRWGRSSPATLQPVGAAGSSGRRSAEINARQSALRPLPDSVGPALVAAGRRGWDGDLPHPPDADLWAWFDSGFLFSRSSEADDVRGRAGGRAQDGSRQHPCGVQFRGHAVCADGFRRGSAAPQGSWTSSAVTTEKPTGETLERKAGL